MATDLFGKPIGGYPQFQLDLWQKRQAALLYHWMSLDYLRGLKSLIEALIHGVDVDLELAKRQGRDAVLTDVRWGARDTAANWSSFAFPAIEAFRQSTNRLIARRAAESYSGTGANQCARLLGEYSSMWMTEPENQRFEAQWTTVNQYAEFIDFAAGTGGQRPHLHDRSMAQSWQAFAPRFPRLPKFRVRTDVESETGKLPLRTGVYVPQDDPFGTLQFAWTGNSDGILGQARTFNDAGLRLVSTIGRDALWLDGEKMATYATDAFNRGELTSRGGFDPGDERDPRWVDVILSAAVITERSCKWYFVERVDGEFDDEPVQTGSEAVVANWMRAAAGEPCPREGWWVTPAMASSRRRFKTGDVMPDLQSAYGATIWQWDAVQD